MKPVLTKEIAYQSLQDFFIENPKPMVIFGTGTSCAIDPAFGMIALQEHLTEHVPIHCDAKLKNEWDEVIDALNSGRDLENAMNAVKSDTLIDEIVKITAEYIEEKNREYSILILSGDKNWPAEKLFSRLVAGLPETDKCLHVATTNYDLLAEYAFSKIQIPYLTGFTGGVCRKFNPEKSERAVIFTTNYLAKNKIHRKMKIEKHIRIYKVHGSINTFELKDTIVENDEWITVVPAGVKRIIITPGMEKNKKLHERRPELLGEFDQAIQRHNAFLFLGFGFNDDPIFNRTLRQKLTDQGSPGLVITKESNARIDKLLSESEHLWLVCQNRREAGSIIYNSRFNENLIIPNRDLWIFDNFTTEFFGG